MLQDGRLLEMNKRHRILVRCAAYIKLKTREELLASWLGIDYCDNKLSCVLGRLRNK